MNEEIKASTHDEKASNFSTSATSDSAPGVLFDLFFEPRAAFQALNRKPRWVLALATIVVMGMMANFVFIQRIGIESMLRMSIQSRAKPGQAVDAGETARTVSQNPGVIATFYLGPLLAGPIIPLILAAIFTGIFAIFGGEAVFKKIFSVTTHAMAASSIVMGSLQILIVLLKDDYSGINLANLVMSNLAFLVDSGAGLPALRSLLGSLDLFSFWLLFLWIVGFQATMPKTAPKMVVAVVLTLWALYVVAKAGLAALGFSMG